jgi:hypothetical protein
MLDYSRWRTLFIILPLLLIISTYFVFRVMLDNLPPSLGLFFGYLFYWGFWCLIVPFTLIRPAGMRRMFSRPDAVRPDNLPTSLMWVLLGRTGRDLGGVHSAAYAARADRAGGDLLDFVCAGQRRLSRVPVARRIRHRLPSVHRIRIPVPCSGIRSVPSLALRRPVRAHRPAWHPAGCDGHRIWPVLGLGRPAHRIDPLDDRLARGHAVVLAVGGGFLWV